MSSLNNKEKSEHVCKLAERICAQRLGHSSKAFLFPNLVPRVSLLPRDPGNEVVVFTTQTALDLIDCFIDCCPASSLSIVSKLFLSLDCVYLNGVKIFSESNPSPSQNAESLVSGISSL